MANQALAVVEAALRVRKLDRTLTTALPSLERVEAAAAATDVARLDACLRGGLPRGQLSEIVGPRSSGRTTLLLQSFAAATRRGEIVALVDTFDRLDVASAASAGVDLDRLLWIRGAPVSSPSPPSPLPPSPLFDRAVERALKALNLVLQAGGFGVVALDLADTPLPALNRIPFTTWLRVQRTIEGSETTCVLVAAQPLARSAGGLTLSLAGRPQWAGNMRPQASGLRPPSEALGPGPGASSCSRRLAGLEMAVRVVSPRRGTENTTCISSVSQCLGVPLR